MVLIVLTGGRYACAYNATGPYVLCLVCTRYTDSSSSIIFYEYYVLITNFITVAAAINTAAAAAVIFS